MLGGIPSEWYSVVAIGAIVALMGLGYDLYKRHQQNVPIRQLTQALKDGNWAQIYELAPFEQIHSLALTPSDLAALGAVVQRPCKPVCSVALPSESRIYFRHRDRFRDRRMTHHGLQLIVRKRQCTHQGACYPFYQVSVRVDHDEPHYRGNGKFNYHRDCVNVGLYDSQHAMLAGVEAALNKRFTEVQAEEDMSPWCAQTLGRWEQQA